MTLSKKIYIGLLAGTIAGVAIFVIVRIRRQTEFFSPKSEADENDMLEIANHYLLLARNKVDEMAKVAEHRSNLLLKQANELLSLAKEKTSKIYSRFEDQDEDVVDIIKDDIRKRIDELKKEIEN